MKTAHGRRIDSRAPRIENGTAWKCHVRDEISTRGRLSDSDRIRLAWAMFYISMNRDSGALPATATPRFLIRTRREIPLTKIA